MELMRQIHAGIACPGACFFRPAPVFRVDNYSFSGTPLPPEEPAAKNPPDGAMLVYFLPTQAREVTLTIFDRDREIVRRCANTDKEEASCHHAAVAERWFARPPRIENTAGMHRLVWDLRWRYSGESAADNESGSAAPSGPRVPPGTCDVTLTVDGNSYTQRVTVRVDPRSSASISWLNEQFRLSKEVLDQSLQSRTALAEVDFVNDELANLKPDKLSPHPELVAQVSDFETLVRHILSGDAEEKSDIKGLISANAGLDGALNAVEGGDRTFASLYALSPVETRSPEANCRVGYSEGNPSHRTQSGLARGWVGTGLNIRNWKRPASTQGVVGCGCVQLLAPVTEKRSGPV
jgi:hypothetical protein